MSKICEISDCIHYDLDTNWRCSKHIKIDKCDIIPLINNRNHANGMLKEKIKLKDQYIEELEDLIERFHRATLTPVSPKG